MKPAPSRISRAASALVAAAVLVSTLSVAVPAFAGIPQAPADFDRQQVASRALKWARGYVPYSQSSYYRGWRQDCSGFVSMAWGLDQSRTTWTLADIARPIPKWALQTGDVLINNASVEQAHVVIFDKWANKEHTAYWEFEQCGSVGKTAHRVVPYPFWTSDRASYVPYRFAGGVKQYVRKPKPRPKAVRTVATVLSSIQATNAKAATAVPVASKTPSAKKPAATKPAARPTAKNAHARTAASRTVPASAAPPPIRKAAPRRAGWIPVGRNSGSDVLRDPVVVTLIRDLVAWIAR